MTIRNLDRLFAPSFNLLKQLHIDRRPAAKKRRPGWLVPALVTTVLVLTLAAGLLAWTWR